MKRSLLFAGLLALIGVGFAVSPQMDQGLLMASTAMSAPPASSLPMPVFVVPPSAETPDVLQEQFMRIAKCVRSGDTGICPPTSPTTGAPGSGGLAKATS